MIENATKGRIYIFFTSFTANKEMNRYVMSDQIATIL
jgi:hypothetical protein